MLVVGYDIIDRAVFRAGLGLCGGGRLWGPVWVQTQFLGKMPVSSFGRRLAWTQPEQTLVCLHVNHPLKIPRL